MDNSKSTPTLSDPSKDIDELSEPTEPQKHGHAPSPGTQQTSIGQTLDLDSDTQATFPYLRNEVCDGQQADEIRDTALLRLRSETRNINQTTAIAEVDAALPPHLNIVHTDSSNNVGSCGNPVSLQRLWHNAQYVQGLPQYHQSQHQSFCAQRPQYQPPSGYQQQDQYSSEGQTSYALRLQLLSTPPAGRYVMIRKWASPYTAGANSQAPLTLDRTLPPLGPSGRAPLPSSRAPLPSGRAPLPSGRTPLPSGGPDDGANHVWKCREGCDKTFCMRRLRDDHQLGIHHHAFDCAYCGRSHAALRNKFGHEKKCKSRSTTDDMGDSRDLED